MPNTDRLLRSVATRQRVNGVMNWFGRLVITFGVIFLLLLISSRGLALLTVDLDPLSTLAVPMLALLLAVLFFRGRGVESAARLIDRKMQLKDLFLTSTKIVDAPGAYKPLVAQAAESSAGTIHPKSVEPFQWRHPTTWAAGTVLLLVICTWGIPQFDPFGILAEREKIAERQRELSDEKKLADKKIEELKQQPLAAELSDEVEKRLEELKAAFDKMKPQQMQANLDRLKEQQKKIGDEWRKIKDQNLNPLETDDAQKFGQMNPKAKQWRKQLQKGDASGLKKELTEAQELAKKLAQETDPGKKRELSEALQEKLQELSEFARNEAGNQQLQDSLQRAMEQLQASGMDGLSSEALDALQTSLELSSMQMDAMAQMMRDQQALEEMLKLIQLGQIANAGGKLGSPSEQLARLEGYIETYERICKECGACQGCGGSGKANGKVGVCPFCKGTGQAAGPGMGGAGRGAGSVAPEDDSIESEFKAKKSRTFLQAGKMLLQWKENELPESGEARKTYKKAVRDVKQGVSEAIRAEEVPPGYHDGIKHYFDSIEDDE